MIDLNSERTHSVSDVCLVLVTYHPDADFPSRFARIREQVRSAVIVDNASDIAAQRMLDALRTQALTVVRNPVNVGIAGALNTGVQHAVTQGFSWALLLDQDTTVDLDMVEQLLAARAAFPAPERLALIGSGFRDTEGRPDESRAVGPACDLWREVESVITSGSLLSLDVSGRLGPFREDFFIDYVDTEYCLRARREGYRIIQTRRPLMSHTVGAPTRHRLFGPARWTTNHSPERRYYIARNNTALLREYGAHGRNSWRMKSIARSLRLCKRIAFYEDEKLLKIRAVAQGWWDGVRGKMGPRR